MSRNILLLRTIAAGLVLAGALVLVPGTGYDGDPSVAQAQSQEQDAAETRSATGGTEARGVAMRPEDGGRQAALEQGREAEPPPIGLTERGKAALEQARRGNAQPAGRPTVEAEAIPTGPGSDEPQPDIPALGTSFQGMADTGSFPPDHVVAAGPNNIVVSTNGGVNVLDKRGNSLSSQTLAGFFSALGPEHNDVFDPWLAYDPYINRFWIIAVSGRTTGFNNIVIGLSNTHDATLGWRLWELDATVDGGTDTSNWCDYPKLGFDAQAIYITCNMFRLNTTTSRNEFQYSKIRTMTKVQFVNNESFIDWWDRWGFVDGNTGSNEVFTTQPAQMFGASTADGEFLVSAQGGGGTGNTLDVWRITNAAECCDGDTVVPNFAHAARGVGSYGPSDGARQPGTATQIDNGDARLLYAFWKNGRLSTGHTVACSGTPTNACGGFTELNVGSYPTISTLNNFAVTAGGQDVYYPAASVNAADDKTMVFTVSDPSLRPSAAYIGIPSSTDCTGCLDGPTTLLRTGQSDSYVRLDTRNRNRWGDYSGASPDPNGEGIWVVGEFVAATANTWGVQAGLTYQSTPPPTNDNFRDTRSVSGSLASVGGTNRYATREPNEPATVDGRSTSHSVWYRFTAPSTGRVTVDTCAASFDTLLGVYRGSLMGGLSLVAADDDTAGCGAGDVGSKVTFSVTGGTTYRVLVDGFAGAQGNFTLSVADITPPRVTRVSPDDLATGISPATNVLAFFSEPMRSGLIDTDTFRLRRSGASTNVAAVVTYDSATKKATLNPNASLQPGETYIATVTPGATDLADNQLDQDRSAAGNQPETWRFTVRR